MDSSFKAAGLIAGRSAVAIRCGPNGVVKTVLYDDLGLRQQLTPGHDFRAIVAPLHWQKGMRFLDAVRAGSSMDWELNVTLPNGVTPLFFSGCVTHFGMIIVGTKEPLSQAWPHKLAQFARRHSKSLAVALKAIGEPTQAVVAERKRPASDLRLLEMAAHDLRNPISGILASSQYLIEDAGRILSERHLSLLRAIESSSRLILRLLQDMLEIPSIKSSKPQLEFHTTDISPLVADAVAANDSLAESKRVHLELQIEEPIPAVQADPVKIGNALNWLLANAIFCCQADVKIEVRVDARPPFAVITLQEEGAGMVAHDLTSLFASSRRNRRGRGLSEELAALTLDNAMRIVEGHRGTIKVDDDEIRGSAVTIILPASQEEAGTTGARKPHPKRRAASAVK